MLYYVIIFYLHRINTSYSLFFAFIKSITADASRYVQELHCADDCTPIKHDNRQVKHQFFNN